MKNKTTRLGARILSEGELNAILPNAESVFEQIAVFRNSIPGWVSKQRDWQYEIEQKTNNIGIMGCRGAGKTSILKTFYHRLKTENENEGKNKGDIILPVIIPENMSVGTTLMDAVLGRLKSVVEERKEREERNKYAGDCIYSGRASIEQQYNELVKQYCYIKKDYRDILIRQFTTEQNYVDKTKKVFGSDSLFINLFHQFVIRLLQDGRDTEDGKAKEPPMMFLFIDDVDLSANRCMDVVRTLLAYLSNPRIVTFIAGDMETFEEELTLEFLRQEGALKENVFRGTYYTVNDVLGKGILLERKKALAGEYLKKIIPPAYRRTIRYWSLEERANYRITGDDGREQKNLAELLEEATKEKLEELYFSYMEGEERKCMRLAFHMFDDTSRGLNNVYNVLQEICDVRANEQNISEEREMLLYWHLIETMVDSKPLYLKYKPELLKQIIVLGQESVKVDFANAYQFLYGEADENKEKQKKTEKNVTGFSAKERFAIYFLIDFVAELFFKEQYDDEDYENYFNLNNRIIQEYLSDEAIDDKIAPKRKLIKELVSPGSSRVFDKDSAQSILIKLLQGGGFIFELHLIRCLGRELIYCALASQCQSFSDKEIVYWMADALSGAIRAVNESEESIRDYMAGLYIQMQDTIPKLINKLSLNPWIIYGRQLAKDFDITADGMRYINTEGDFAKINFINVEKYLASNRRGETAQSRLLWAEYGNRNLLYWICYEEKLRERRIGASSFHIKIRADETVLAGMTKTIIKQMTGQKSKNRYEVRALKEVGYDGLLEGKKERDKKEIQVIEQIDAQGLWESDFVKEKVFQYLQVKTDNYLRKISRGRAIFDATELVAGAYAEFETCIKGKSGQVYASGLDRKVQCVMFLDVNDGWQEQYRFSDRKFYLRLEQVLIIQCLLEEFLDTYRGVLYGKKEVRMLLSEIKELPFVIQTDERDKIDRELQEREQRFFEQISSWYRDKTAKRFEVSDRGKAAVEHIRERWYEIPGEIKELDELIGKELGETGKENIRYFRYLVQKSRIEQLKEMLNEKNEEKRKTENEWSDIEPDFPKKDYLFFFHSYLRYLQANDSDTKKASIQAGKIVKLVQYMMDSEISVGEKIQNDVYQAVGSEIGLTEGEFERLFEIREEEL